MISTAILIGLSGAIVAVVIFVANVTWRSGERIGDHNARIESLEEWRGNIRMDMHEISDQIQDVGRKLATLTAMLEERTERRNHVRP